MSQGSEEAAQVGFEGTLDCAPSREIQPCVACYSSLLPLIFGKTFCPTATPAREKVTPTVKHKQNRTPPPKAPEAAVFKPRHTTDAFGLVAQLLIKSKGA